MTFDLDTRTYTIPAEIVGDTATDFIQFLNQINRKDKFNDYDHRRLPIHLHINSYGGEVYPTMAMVGAIQASDTPVYTYCTGYAFSAAFILFLAGDKRFVSEYTTIMFHELSSWGYGKLEDIKKDVVELEKLQKMITDFVINRTDIPTKLLKDTIEKKNDLYIRMPEIMDYKCADEILEANRKKIKTNSKY